MKAGFAKVNITPPLGTHMLGFGKRDITKGCESVHDDLFVRALYAEHAGEPVLILAYDVLFFSRSESDRFVGALCRALDLRPRQVMLNTSHTHAGPALGTWAYADYNPIVDPLYVDQVERAAVAAAKQARASAREVTLWAGATKTDVPVSRRFVNAEGKAEWRPDLNGEMYDGLPFCLLRDAANKPVCLLYSISCHTSTVGGWAISADYSGVACDLLNKHIGVDAAMFLQGCAGDTKARPVSDGPADATGRASWRKGDWVDVERAGRSVADAVINALGSLKQHKPRIQTFLRDMRWPLEKSPSRTEIEKIQKDDPSDVRRLWAERQLKRLDHGETLRTHAPVFFQAVQLAEDVRLLALEGEPVAGFAKILTAAFDHGVTFPLGYTNGQGLYLPTERMLMEGGYEVESAYEYGFPAQLTRGYEAVLGETIKEAKAAGVA